MRILVAHTYYRERGGEDESFENEALLLERNDHEVIRFTRHNAHLDDRRRARNAIDAIWNTRDARALRDLVRRTRPDIGHVHNAFPAMSPLVFKVLGDAGVPSVHSLRNYRLVCPNALLYRDGGPCEDCVGRRVAWPGVRHRCYRDSRTATAVTAGMLATHRALGIWPDSVDHFIALSNFQRDRLVQGGLDPSRTTVKPNFVHPDRGLGRGDGGFALFVGRLSPEKGVLTMLDAWSESDSRLPLRIVGDGPLGPTVARTAESSPGVEWVGRRSRPEVDELLASAAVVIFPSEWYEPFGRVVVEAFARGTPVITSDRGAPAEMVDDAVTGLHFTAGDPTSMVNAVERFASAPDTERAAMRTAARAAFENRYTAERNLDVLLAVYEKARTHAARVVAKPD